MPLFFPTPAHFRAWLEKHHATERELVVGFYRKECGKPSITWPESVDEALCFGWIDGIRRKLTDDSYSIRFTPRKPTSIWSKINLAKMDRLLAEKRVAPAGMKVYESRNPAKTNLYSFERRSGPAHPVPGKVLPQELRRLEILELPTSRLPQSSRPLGHQRQTSVHPRKTPPGPNRLLRRESQDPAPPSLA